MSVRLTPALVKPEDVTHHVPKRSGLSGIVEDLFPTSSDTNPITDVVAGDFSQIEYIRHRWPIRGAKRLGIRRTGYGGLFSVSSGTPKFLLDADINRLGGELVNIGPDNCFIYLSESLNGVEGQATMYLTPGGSWDFRLSKIVWGGSVSAAAVTTNTQIVIAGV